MMTWQNFQKYNNWLSRTDPVSSSNHWFFHVSQSVAGQRKRETGGQSFPSHLLTLPAPTVNKAGCPAELMPCLTQDQATPGKV